MAAVLPNVHHNMGDDSWKSQVRSALHNMWTAPQVQGSPTCSSAGQTSHAPPLVFTLFVIKLGMGLQESGKLPGIQTCEVLFTAFLSWASPSSWRTMFQFGGNCYKIIHNKHGHLYFSKTHTHNLYVHLSDGVCGGQRVPDPLELELQVFANCRKKVLRMAHGPCASTANAL